MPSPPDSGPTMMSTLSCSTSLRVAFTATSGLASDEALIISILRPATTPPRCLTASSAPRMPSAPPAANGPSSVASRPIFTGWPDCAHTLPTMAVAAAAPRIVRTQTLLLTFTVVSFGGKEVGSADLGEGLVRSEARAELRPQSEQAIRGKQHDGEEHATDHEVEALAVDQVDREGLQQHEHDRAEEGTDRMPHTAEHGDHQHVDEPRRAHRARCDQSVVPDEEHATDRGDQPGERVRRHAMRHDIKAQR